LAAAGKRRGSEERPVPQNFKQELKRLNLAKPRAIEAQRIGAIAKDLEPQFQTVTGFRI
jgi:hypothetical protein